MLKVDIIMKMDTDTPLPYYLQVAHWLYEEKRFLSAREAATIVKLRLFWGGPLGLWNGCLRKYGVSQIFLLLMSGRYVLVVASKV